MTVISSYLARRRYEIFLFFTALFIRLPFFFRDYMDHDESTFILMGQSVADGHLPYDHLWDLKSPFLFYIFGLIETIFPHSFVAIRFVGLLVIFLSALLLMRIARQTNLQNPFLIALSYVLLSSQFGSVQGVMSEHFAVLFILAGLLLFIKKTLSIQFFWSGLFFGFALLCKLNYAYAIVFFFLYYLISNLKHLPIQKLFFQLLLAGIGIILTFFLVAIPFIIEGKMKLFMDGVFFAPLAYGHYSSYKGWNNLARTWWIIATGLIISYAAWKKSTKEQKEFAMQCILLLLGTIYSFYTIGSVNGHYLIQAYPLMILLIWGIIIKRNFKPALVYVAVVVFLLAFESMGEYYRLAKHYSQTGTLYNGKSFLVIKELKKRGLENKRIFFSDYHIGYWFLNQYPLTKSTTHPSNIGRPFLFKYFGNTNKTSFEELKDLMEIQRPEIIVNKYNYLAHFQVGGIEERYFASRIASDYTFIYQDSTNRIYIWEMNAGKKK